MLDSSDTILKWGGGILLAVFILLIGGFVANQFFPVTETGTVQLKTKSINGGLLSTRTDYVVVTKTKSYTVSTTDYARVEKGDQITVKAPRLDFIVGDAQVIHVARRSHAHDLKTE